MLQNIEEYSPQTLKFNPPKIGKVEFNDNFANDISALFLKRKNQFTEGKSLDRIVYSGRRSLHDVFASFFRSNESDELLFERKILMRNIRNHLL